MRNTTKIVLCIFIFFLFSCKENNTTKVSRFYESDENMSGMVWICTGKSSHAYHANSDCYGIKSCRAKKRKITLEEAKAMRRTPCHYCHPIGNIRSLDIHDLYKFMKYDYGYEGNYEVFLESLKDDDFCFDVWQNVVSNSTDEITIDYVEFKELLGI